MNCRDLEWLYDKAKDSYKDRKFLYVFPQPDNNYWAVNYDAVNCELNSFLRLFSISGGDGQHKISEDGNHQEVWFEVDEEFSRLVSNTFALPEAIKRLGVEIVFDYPFFKKKSTTEDYQKIGQAWNEQYRYRDEEDE
jgi:hypothetical protein